MGFAGEGKHYHLGCHEGRPAMKCRPTGLGWIGYAKLVVALVLVGMAPMVVPASLKAQDSTADPTGRGVIVTDSGLVLPVREIQEKGFVVSTPCGKEAFVTSGSHVSDVAIVMDPGHGGRETGVIGPNGLSEEDLNLTIAQMAAAILESRDYDVLLTRNSDVRIPIAVRVEIAEALDPEVFVSIHHNGGAMRRSSEPGTETYHQVSNPNSRRLAGILYEEIRDALSRYDVVWRDAGLRGANAVVRKRDGRDLYGLLRNTPGLVSVVTEAGYLSNSAEELLFFDPAVQAVEASAIADGIVRYLTTSDEGSGYNGTLITSRSINSGGAGGCEDPPLNNATDSAGHNTQRYTELAGFRLSAVQSLVRQGIFDDAECVPGRFCPNDPIERWLMAVWLVRMLDGGGPAAISVTRFAEIDPDRWWAPYEVFLAGLRSPSGGRPALPGSAPTIR